MKLDILNMMMTLTNKQRKRTGRGCGGALPTK
jgi:hypothetical protein